MSVVIITGSCGLIGSEAAKYFSGRGHQIVGLDNNMREIFFGAEASTNWNKLELEKTLGKAYIHHDLDIRDDVELKKVFSFYRDSISLVIHTAAQPSHDWAASNPQMDFSVNANGTLNLLEATREFCSTSPFIFTSTNKVYGDTPNRLPLQEKGTRWEIEPGHEYWSGIDEGMSVDQTTHSLFGVSKLSADLMVQEYGRYFDMPTACFRGGCLTGPSHSGTQLHGFLSYLMKCAMTETPYEVFGYKGKQVRDNIHSSDLVRAFNFFYESPQVGEVYNIGGGRNSNCSMLEAIELCEKISGRKMNYGYRDDSRVGDHIWWISDNSKFSGQYPDWQLKYNIEGILQEIYQMNVERWIEAKA